MYLNLIYLVVCVAPDAAAPPQILPAPEATEVAVAPEVPPADVVTSEKIDAALTSPISPVGHTMADPGCRGVVFEEEFASAHYPMGGGCCGCAICDAKWTRKRAKIGISPGDMYPHMPYFPAYHGYYYFRPYNYAHIAQHQAIAQRWGADPRTPYQTPLFDALYAEHDARRLSQIPEVTEEPEVEEEIIKKPSDFFTGVRKNVYP